MEYRFFFNMDTDTRYIERKKKIREHRDKTYEERKAKAFATGKKVLFVTCPLCGRGRPMQDRWGNKAKFKVKPEYFIIQARYGSGRASGFFLKDDESLGIDDVKKEYPGIYNNIKRSVQQLAKLFK